MRTLGWWLIGVACREHHMQHAGKVQVVGLHHPQYLFIGMHFVELYCAFIFIHYLFCWLFFVKIPVIYFITI